MPDPIEIIATKMEYYRKQRDHYRAALELILSRYPREDWPEHPACQIAAEALAEALNV